MNEGEPGEELPSLDDNLGPRSVEVEYPEHSDRVIIRQPGKPEEQVPVEEVGDWFAQHAAEKQKAGRPPEREGLDRAA